MQENLGKPSIKEFDKKLVFAKSTKITDNFKAILKGGIDIFHNGAKVAMIYYNKDDGVIIDTAGFDTSNFDKAGISPKDSIKLGKSIWAKITTEYNLSFHHSSQT